jgi:hypothetical protein
MVGQMGTLLRFVAIVTSAIVLIGFAAFAADELDRGSKSQQNAIADELGTAPTSILEPNPTPDVEAARESRNGTLREAIDDANDVLLAPFGDLVGSDNAWVERGVPSLLALLIYGLGLGTLARALPKRQVHGGDWRTA